MDIQVTFTTTSDTDETRFKECLVRIYDGSAEDEDTQYVLDHTESVK